MNPDGSLAVRRKPMKSGEREAEPLAEIKKILLVPEALNQPIGRRQQGRQTHQNTINEVHLDSGLVRDCEHPRSGKQGNPASYPRIEGLRTQTVYYSLMRNFLACLLFAISVGCLISQKSTAQEIPGTPSATKHIVSSDSHEGVTIKIDPWTEASRYKDKFPKKSPFSKGIVALDVSFRNDNDHGIKVNLQSIRLLVQVSEDSRQELIPLSAEDVADAVTLKENTKDPTAKRSPLPIPIPSTGVKTSRDKNWTTLRDACQDAGVPSNVVAAHETVKGLIYFDLRGETDLLENAHFYLPNIVTMGDNQPLSYFDIALGRESAE